MDYRGYKDLYDHSYAAYDNFIRNEMVYYLMREVTQAYLQTEMIQPEDQSFTRKPILYVLISKQNLNIQ
jgi:parvulin-like peptidyl-prolyl isomerase